MSIIPLNNQITNLTRDINDADILAKPSLLLKLKDILSSSSQERDVTVAEIWKCKLPHSLLEALRQDFSLISGSWLTACQLINIAVECCHFDPINLQELKKQYIPALVFESLNICKHIMKEYQTVGDLFKANFCGNISWIIASLTSLMKKYVFVSVLVVSSKNFLQFIMVEEDRLAILALSLLKNTVEANCDVFYHASESRMHNVIDELAYKITSTKDVKVARVTVSILLNLLRLYISLLDLFVTKRYRGFKTYLNKWRNKGFDDNIEQISKMLDAKLEQMKSSQKFANAAIVVQSWYRGHRTRQTLKSASRAISKFQRTFRNSMQAKEKRKAERRFEQAKKDFDEDRRRKGFVSSKVKQLKSIESIPAKTVNNFFRDMEHGSARKIQATWTGWKTRNSFKNLAPNLKREKAAILIQRQIRRWLESVNKRKKEARTDMIPDGLTDSRRIELQTVLVNIREKFPKSDVGEQELMIGHEKAHHMLNNHVIGLRAMRRRDDHRRALIGQLTIQSELLSKMPSLSLANERTIEQLTSRSTPVMIAARERHVELIIDIKRPWWEKLSETTTAKNELNTHPLGIHSEYITDYEKNF